LTAQSGRFKGCTTYSLVESKAVRQWGGRGKERNLEGVLVTVREGCANHYK